MTAAKSRVTTDWYFKLYGSGGRSFHAVEKKDKHVGSLPVSPVFGTAPPRVEAAAPAAVGGLSKPPM